VAAQYTSLHLGETLLLHGMIPSIGSVGDAFDNALAETTIGLYKHESSDPTHPFRRGPPDRLVDLELITADWVHWYNTSRLMHHLGRIPPVEAEANYYAQTIDDQPVAHT
jgi:putative transposase